MQLALLPKGRQTELNAGWMQKYCMKLALQATSRISATTKHTNSAGTRRIGFLSLSTMFGQSLADRFDGVGLKTVLSQASIKKGVRQDVLPVAAFRHRRQSAFTRRFRRSWRNPASPPPTPDFLSRSLPDKPVPVMKTLHDRCVKSPFASRRSVEFVEAADGNGWTLNCSGVNLSLSCARSATDRRNATGPDIDQTNISQ